MYVYINSAAVRVEIKWRVSNRPEQRRQFVKWLNELQKDTNSVSNDKTETLMRKLKVDGIEILNSTDDRDVVVWFRCKSSNALRRMKEMTQSAALARLLWPLTDDEYLLLEIKKSVNLDDDQLETELGDIGKLRFQGHADANSIIGGCLVTTIEIHLGCSR